MEHVLLMCLVVFGITAAEPAAMAPATPPDRRAGGPPATQAVILPIDVHCGIYLARSEIHISVSTTGLLRAERTSNKRYGPKDGNWTEEAEVRQGQLSAAQIAELSRLLAAWDGLAEKYGGVPDGPEISFKYGDKVVKGGSALPPQVTYAFTALRALAESMPKFDP